jgi:hemolysin D
LSPSKTVAAEIRQFQSETDAIREAPEPIWARMTVFVLTGMLLTCIAILFLTRLDRVVSSVGGKIVPGQKINVYQALDPSIIKTIDVHEGDEVKKGQLLATLDPTFATADVQQYKQQIASLEAQSARDEAELNRHPLKFPSTSDPDRLRYQSLQAEAYKQHVAQYQAQLNSFDAKIAQTKATIKKLQTDKDRYSQREDIANQIEQMRSLLASHGTGSKLNLLQSQDSRLELIRSLEYSQNSLVEAQHTLASQKADRQAFIEQWFGQISQDLVTARNNLDTARSNFEKASRRKELVRLTANEPSVILTMAKLSVGSVLKEGDALFTLMPVNTKLEAEANIASRDIGFVRVGDRCTMKIDAFNFVEHGTAEGRVRWISAGAFTTDDNGQPVPAYYKLNCSVDDTHFVNVPKKFRLIPGMTLTVEINVGSRSAAMYLLEGVLRGVNDAMREP